MTEMGECHDAEAGPQMEGPNRHPSDGESTPHHKDSDILFLEKDLNSHAISTGSNNFQT